MQLPEALARLVLQLRERDAHEQDPLSESTCTDSARSAQSAKDGSRVNFVNGDVWYVDEPPPPRPPQIHGI